MCSSPALHSLSLQRNPKGQSLLSSDSTSGELLLLDEKVPCEPSSFLINYYYEIYNSEIVICLFVLPKQWMLIQRTVNSNRLHTLRDHLSEGSVYISSGFDFTRSNNDFRLSDAHVSIRFNDGTSFTERNNSVKSIITEIFRNHTRYCHCQILD